MRGFTVGSYCCLICKVFLLCGVMLFYCRVILMFQTACLICKVFLLCGVMLFYCRVILLFDMQGLPAVWGNVVLL